MNLYEVTHARFKNILFYVDGTDDPTASLIRAVRLAETNHARLTLIDVVEEVETPSEIRSRFHVDLTDLLKSKRKQALENLAARLNQNDDLIYTKVLTGIPFVEVIKFVISGGYDLLMKVARPPSGISEKVFGSNDLHLLRKCPCPVLIDKPNSREYYQQVLATVALDISVTSSCDSLVIELSSSLAKREEATIDVVHAWQLEGESMFRHGRFKLPDIELEAMLKHEKQTQNNKLDSLLKNYELSVDSDNIHLIKAQAAESINRVAGMIQADIIVMCTVGRTGIPGLFIGNTAEEVLQSTNTSILAIEPAGFVSPVK